MGLRFKMEKLSDVAVLWCAGRLVVGSATNVLWDQARELLSDRPRLTLDLSGVEAIDAAGLGTLVKIHVWATTKGREITVGNPSSRVMSAIDLVGLRSVFQICSEGGGALGASSCCGCAGRCA